MEKVVIQAIKSKIITEGDSLPNILKKVLKREDFPEKTVLVIASKVVAVSQKRTRNIGSEADFKRLVEEEADVIIGGGPVILTLKNDILIPWAGIDRSNVAQGKAILWPKDPFQVAQSLLSFLKKELKRKKMGVIISDSHCIPLRTGVSGVALGYAGFRGVNDLRGKKDLFGRKLKVTQQAVADNLASAAHLVMGEGSEQTPFVLIKNAPAEFITAKTDPQEGVISPSECLFSPLYGKFIPRKAGSE